MEWLDGVIAVGVGLIIRFGIPIALTALVVRLLLTLDERWQAEAERDQTRAPARNIGCWDAKNCSAEQRAQCTAYAHPETPCWQLFRSEDGQLKEKCLACQVFRKAPVPITI